MHVVFGVKGEFVVDHGGERLNVQTACCNIGCNHHACLTRLECGKRLVALLLILVAVNLHHVVAVAVEEVAQAIRLNLPVYEDERLVPVTCLEEVAEKRTSAAIIHWHDHLAHVFVGLIASRNLHRDWLMQEVVRERANRFGEGGGEEEALAPLWDQRKDALEVWHEAHVEHAVRFVKDQDRYLRKVDRLGAGVIKKSAWRCNENLHAGEKHLLLWWHGDTAIDNTAPQWEVLPVGGATLGDLHGELARWCQDECANGVTRWAR